MSYGILLLSVFISVASVNGNIEGDLLHNWRVMLYDPNNVLQSWDATLVNPCTWFHITCNTDASVVRVDLGNAGLSGPLSRGLAQLANLQYLEVYENNLTGVIPSEFGNLTSLVSLDLYNNQLSGSIPPSLGNLKSLRYLNVSGNFMTGRVPSTTSKGLAITTIIKDPAAS